LLVHYDVVRDLYKDTYLNTENSIDGDPETLADEHYICPSTVKYAQPLRALDAKGRWRVIVQNVRVLHDSLSQSVRLEECENAGELCRLTPNPYEAECLQKAIYHR